MRASIGTTLVITNVWGDEPILDKIVRETATLYITKSGKRFHKKPWITKGGAQWKSGVHFARICKEEEKEGIKQKMLLREIRRIIWEYIPSHALSQIIEIVKDNELSQEGL